MAPHDVPWRRLDDQDPATLEETRRLAHWAVQLVCPVGSQLVSPAPDYSHTALTWLDEPGLLATHPVGAARWRAALRVADLTVVLTDADGRTTDALPLAGRTLEEGLEWINQMVASRVDGVPDKALELVGYTMQAHPVKDGARFAGDPEKLAALEHWFRNAAHLLEAVRAEESAAGPVRCWPHHFDIATLATFDGPEVDAEHARSLGFGMSPGDDTYAQPYWYVLPWPVPSADALDKLDEGHWHTDGFVGAVLTGPHDRSTVSRFLSSADRVGRKAIGVFT